MNRTTTLLPLALLALTSCGHKAATGDDAAPETVDVATAVTDSVLLSSDYPGYLTADRTVSVVARVNGQILSKNFSDGQTVKAGQTLFTIEDTQYRDAVSRAEAALATARSEYDYASSHYEAVKRALESDAVSKMEVAQAESAVEQADAAIKSAQATLQTARRMLGYCTVTAPFDGQVSTANYDVGAYVGGEAQPVALTEIYDNTSMSVKFAIDDDRYLALVSAMEGHEQLELDSVPLQFSDSVPHTYTGQLTFIAPALNKSTGTLQLKCKVENPYGELKPGMFVTVSLPYQAKADAVLVRDASIGTDQLGKYLYVVNDSDRVVYTPVTVGETYDDTMRIVNSGIAAGQRYVTKAILKVREGMKVKPRATD